MMVIPLKWLPWLLVIGGIALIADGETEGVIALIIGVVWLILRSPSKGSTSQSASSAKTATTQITTQTKQPSQQPKQTVQSDAVCPVCGTHADNGVIFCPNCGTKLTQ